MSPKGNSGGPQISLLMLLAEIYPITLGKLVLLGPFCLLAIVALSRLFEARVAVMLSLTGPIATGIRALHSWVARMPPPILCD